MLGDISVKIVDEPISSIEQLEVTDFQYNRLASQMIGEIKGSDILDDEELELFNFQMNKSFDAKPLRANKLVVVLRQRVYATSDVLTVILGLKDQIKQSSLRY